MLDLSSLFVFPLFLIFLRIGACVMVYPGFADVAISPRTRLVLAVMISLAFFPLLEPSMPTMPESTALFVQYILVEVVIGVMFASAARVFMAAMHVAGELIGFTSGMHAATLFDPSSGASTTAPGLLLGLIATLLIFVANIHHIALQGIAESYMYFPPGNLPDLGDAANALTGVIRDLFYVGVKIAAPVMAIGFLGYVGFGIFNRLIPQLQVFFVALPVTIVVGILVLSVAIGGMVNVFMEELEAHAILFIQDEDV